MPITSLTCTSRQARTHRLHWMQASRLTAMAGWLRSGSGCPRWGKRLSAMPMRSAQDQKFEHHPARRLGAVGGGLHLHAGRRLADAARGQHPLALDLDHAGAAVAVRPVAGLGRIAQMRDVGAEAPGDLPDGLAVARLDLAALEHE